MDTLPLRDTPEMRPLSGTARGIRVLNDDAIHELPTPVTA